MLGTITTSFALRWEKYDLLYCLYNTK